MEKFRGWVRSRPILWVVAPAAVALILAFAGGFFAADDSNKVTDLNTQLADAHDEVGSAEDAESYASDEASELSEELEAVKGELVAERSLNGKSTVANDEESEYETDFAWEAAGTVGYLTMKPLSFERQGSSWLLTVEAKNEASEPKTPFCGDAGAAIGDSTGNTYTGETVISESSDSCEELQPGMTGSFISEFSLPPEAKPVVAGIYGDWEQEDEAKFWALPK